VKGWEVTLKAFDEKERLEYLNRCLKELPPKNLNLIKKYHQAEEADRDSHKELFRALGITPNALRIRAYRIRVEIEECVNNCLERQSQP
jgi:hypothetical protein